MLPLPTFRFTRPYISIYSLQVAALHFPTSPGDFLPPPAAARISRQPGTFFVFSKKSPVVGKSARNFSEVGSKNWEHRPLPLSDVHALRSTALRCTDPPYISILPTSSNKSCPSLHFDTPQSRYSLQAMLRGFPNNRGLPTSSSCCADFPGTSYLLQLLRGFPDHRGLFSFFPQR